jgi:hypothetical protein
VIGKESLISHISDECPNASFHCEICKQGLTIKEFKEHSCVVSLKKRLQKAEEKAKKQD